MPSNGLQVSAISWGSFMTRVITSIEVSVAQLRWWSVRQWTVAAATFVVVLIAMGEVGQTLPPASSDRVYPIEWWNFVVLVADSALVAVMIGSFVAPGTKRIASATGGGFTATVATIMLACPVCSPLAIPLLGAGGALAFLRGDRGLIALASIAVLALALILRLSATASCPVRYKPTAVAAQPQP
jgi:hypothetical protein